MIQTWFHPLSPKSIGKSVFRLHWPFLWILSIVQSLGAEAYPEKRVKLTVSPRHVPDFPFSLAEPNLGTSLSQGLSWFSSMHFLSFS